MKLTPANTNTYDPLLGRTYAEIGADARSNHKCQGTGGLPALPGFGNGRGGGGAGGGGYQLIDSTIPGQKDKTETSLFDGVDTRLEAIAQYAGPNPPAALTAALGAIAADAKAAQNAFDAGNDAATAQPIEAGLAAIRALRAQLAGMGLERLGALRNRFPPAASRNAIMRTPCWPRMASSFDAVADDGLVIAGQPVKLSHSCREPRRVGCQRDQRRHRRLRRARRLRAGRREEGRGLHLHLRRARPEKRQARPRPTSPTTTGSIPRIRRFRSSTRRSSSAFPSRPRRSASRSTSRRAASKSPGKCRSNSAT